MCEKNVFTHAVTTCILFPSCHNFSTTEIFKIVLKTLQMKKLVAALLPSSTNRGVGHCGDRATKHVRPKAIDVFISKYIAVCDILSGLG